MAKKKTEQTNGNSEQQSNGEALAETKSNGGRERIRDGLDARNDARAKFLDAEDAYLEAKRAYRDAENLLCLTLIELGYEKKELTLPGLGSGIRVRKATGKAVGQRSYSHTLMVPSERTARAAVEKEVEDLSDI